MYKNLFIILIFLAINLSSNPIEINEYKKVKNITSEIEYFFDKESKYSLKDILTNENLFKRSYKNKLLFGYAYKSSLWIKIVLKNPTNKKIVKILDYDYPVQEKLQLFDINNKSYILGGYKYKKYPAKYLTHPVKLIFNPHEKKNLILKANNENVGFIAKLNLWNLKEFEEANTNKKIILFLFLGGMAALIIYNLFLLFLTKDITYFYYIVMVGSFVTLELFISGFFPLYFQNFFMRKTDLYILLLIMAYSMIYFTSNFLDLEKNFLS